MSLRLKPASVTPMKDMSSHVSPASTQTTVLLAESTTTTQGTMDDTVHSGMDNYMTRNYLWVYILVAIIVLVIVLWFAMGCGRNHDFEKLHCKGVEWIKGSSGRTVMGLLLAIALFLAAWAMSTVAGYYRCACDMTRSNMVMIAFGVLMILILLTFVMFYRGSFTTAYYLALFTMVLGLIITIVFFYYKMNGPALAMLVFFLWSTLMAWVFYRVSCQNPNHGSVSGSHGSPRPHPHPNSPSSH